MKKKDKSKETNLIAGEKVKIQRTEEEKNIFRVIQDDLVPTKHEQELRESINNKEYVEVENYDIQ